MYSLIWTGFSGEQCGPWASCFSQLLPPLKKKLFRSHFQDLILKYLFIICMFNFLSQNSQMFFFLICCLVCPSFCQQNVQVQTQEVIFPKVKSQSWSAITRPKNHHWHMLDSMVHVSYILFFKQLVFLLTSWLKFGIILDFNILQYILQTCACSNN